VTKKATPESANPDAYDYTSIPVGYYDRIYRGEDGIRKLWHVSKFERVLDCLAPENGGALLDVGCFAGTFLSTVPRHRFDKQVGVDILPEQIEYAKHHYSAPFRDFRVIKTIDDVVASGDKFDAVTLIEVIEHLDVQQIRVLLGGIAKVLRPGGSFVLTTPNYASAWPLIETVLGSRSDVTYEDQHITKFSYFNFESKLESLLPGIRDRFAFDLKTTTHFMTPFLAGLSYELGRGLSRALPHSKWGLPVGSLILAKLVKKG
jgi:2-polyprenyl-3-methyl-5-hydroxy-6-metoxy-1,4-benzoquinol methylase